VPWCEDCDRYWSQPTLRDGKSCPTCSRLLVAERPVVEAPKAPWHFRLLVGAGVVYLTFRAYQGVEWLMHRH